MSVDKAKRFLKEGSWAAIILSIVSAILGIVAGSIIELIAPPLFQPPNLLYLTFFVNTLIFLVVGVYAVTLWNKSLRDSENTNQLMTDLLRKLDVKFQYVGIGKGRSGANFAYAAGLIRDAKSEVLILNYEPVQRIESNLNYDREAAISKERKEYYETIRLKIQNSQSGKFKFRRIIQMPETQDISDLFDPTMAEHLRMLAELGTKEPEFVSLKRSLPFLNSTLMIIDRRYILFSVSALDPDDREYYTKGHLVFDDSVGSFASEFVRFFERIDSHASLVKIADLPHLRLIDKLGDQQLVESI